MKIKNTLSSLLFLYSTFAQAHIIVDHQVDPVPLVSIDVYFPVGFASKRDPVDIAGLSIMGDLLDGGSLNLDRNAFQAKLGDYAASFEFQPSREFSTWSLSFPFARDRNYKELISALENNWTKPRFLQKEFEVSKQKLLSRFRAELDSDQSLLVSYVRKKFVRNALGLETFYYDDAQKLKRDHLSTLFNESFRRAGDVWVGVQAPADALPLVISLLEKIFPEKGRCVIGTSREGLPSQLAFEKSQVSWKAGEKHLIVIDRPDRAQLVSSINFLSPNQDHLQFERTMLFGNFLNVENSLGSLLPGEIRVQRGLAYSISGVGSSFYGSPYFGFVTNPQSNRAQEYLELLKDLRLRYFQNASAYEALSSDQWDKAQQSFLYSNLVSRATPTQQLSLRGAAVMRQVSWDFVNGDLKTFLPNRSQLSKTIKDLSRQSIEVIGVVGHAETLVPLLKNLFPEHVLSVVPYEKAIYRLER